MLVLKEDKKQLMGINGNINKIMLEIAKKIVKTVNQTTNDYDAVEEIAKVLKEHFEGKRAPKK